MSKYRKALLVSVASIVLTITGFSICGTHHSVHVASGPIDTAAPPLPAAIEVDSVVKPEEQFCWHPGLVLLN